MPISAPKPCTACGVLVRDGTARCEKHKVRLGQFADSRRGSRQSRGYGAAWDAIRPQIMRRDNGLCQCEECKRLCRVRLAHAVDHRIGKAEWRRLHGTLDGVDDPSNLRAINKDCHKAKTAREAQQGRGVGKV